MSIPKKGGYSGGRPASEMGPPANLPSATIRPRSDGCTELTCPHHGERNSWHAEVVRLRAIVFGLQDRAVHAEDTAEALRLDLRDALAKSAASPGGEFSWQCAHCGEIVRRPTREAAIAAGPWHDKEVHGRCFCGTLLDEHPPGPPCPPPPPPGVSHG